MSSHNWLHLSLSLFAVCILAQLLYRQHFSCKFTCTEPCPRPAHANGRPVTSDSFRCHALTTSGKWSRKVDSAQDMDVAEWRPDQCMMHQYQALDIQRCTKERHLRFVGDSTIRQVFWATAMILDPNKAAAGKKSSRRHVNITFQTEGARLEFIWDPYLNVTAAAGDWHMSPHGNHTMVLEQGRPHATLGGAGLWHARYLEWRYDLDFKKNTGNFSRSFRQTQPYVESPDVSLPHSNDTIFIVAPVLNPYQPNLSEDRASTLTPERIATLNILLHQMEEKQKFDVLWAFLQMTRGLSYAYESTGIHVIEGVAKTRAQMFLNFVCNRRMLQKYPFSTTCCTHPPPLNRIQGIALLLCAVLSALYFASYLASSGGSCLGQKTLKSVLAPGYHNLVLLCSALLYCFLADRSVYCDKIAKDQSLRKFLLFSAATALPAMLLSARPSTKRRSVSEKVTFNVPDDTSILSRQQTDEWKGWMQVLILFYHYFGMSKVLPVYQGIRLLVASYLFMTGFGHTVNLRKTNDFSLRRLASVLVRLNMLGCLLPYVMATDYDFYYFPALCSFWVVVVYCTLYGSDSRRLHVSFYARIVLSMAYVSFLICYPGILETIVRALQRTCLMNLDAREFRFRVSLDTYIVYVGMLGGHMFHKATNGEGWLPLWLGRRDKFHRLVIPACITILSVYAWFLGRFTDKYRSNAYHPYTSPLAVLAFVGLRNSMPWLRSRHSYVFAWLGRCSLETFILQYHIWLAADTKGLLSIPTFTWLTSAFGVSPAVVYWLQFGVATIYFIWTSWAVSRATGVLTGLLVGRGGSAAEEIPKSSTEGVEHRPPFTRISKLALSSPSARITLLLGALWVCNWLW